MKRRTLLKRTGTSIVAGGLASGTAAAYHNGECHEPDEDEDCVFLNCTDLCPNKCCKCICGG